MALADRTGEISDPSRRSGHWAEVRHFGLPRWLHRRNPRYARGGAPTPAISKTVRIAALVALITTALAGRATTSSSVLHAASGPTLSITSVDTMKESMDTDTWPLSAAQIAESVNLAASLNPKYVTVDTFWDYPSYMQQWVNAVRATGRHVWFRIHPNQWEDNNGATGIMTPAAYENAERSFILAHPGLFRSGDILDPCPEPENGKYWIANYGPHWTWYAPNPATSAFNTFIRTTTSVANSALQQLGISGVITTVRSTNSFFATHPEVLEAATVNMMGRITVDSYPDEWTTDPAAATALRVQELNSIYAIWHVPVVIGEMGYSNEINVDDNTQNTVLKAEFAGLANLPYLSGVNYWVGAGTQNSGGYTHLFKGDIGTWTMRPAGAVVATFYKTYGGTAPALAAAPIATATVTRSSTATPTHTPLPSATATATKTVFPSSTASPTASPTSTPSSTATNSPTMTATATPTVPPSSTPATIPLVGDCTGGWTCGDIGGPALAGSQTYTNGTWTLQGAGWDLWLTSGQYHYAWQTMAGDGSLSARIDSQSSTEEWAKAGLLITASTDPQAPHYGVFMTPNHGVMVQYRTSTGAYAQQAALAPGMTPLYLRIVRVGATFAAYTSGDGAAWTPIPGSTVALPLSGPVLAGLAITSHMSGTLGTATFDSVSLQ